MIRTPRLRAEPLEDRLAPAAGDLDPTFGTGGITRFTFGMVRQLATMPDGRALALIDTSNDPAARASIVRIDPNGTIDPTYGTGGVAPVPGAAFFNTFTTAPDGGAYVGWVGSTAGFTVVHVTAGGTIDPTFGSGGTATVPTGLPENSAGSPDFADLVVQPDGRVLVVGDATPDPIILGQPPRYYKLVIGRLTTAGQLDPTFGSGGTAFISDPSATITSLQAGAAALAPDGRIVIAGTASTTQSGVRPQVSSPAVTRLTADGQPDLTFAARASVLLPFPDGTGGRFSAVSVLPDGRVVAAGDVRLTSGAVVGGAARLLANGQPDPTYGNGGLAVTATVVGGSGGITFGNPAIFAAVDPVGRAVFDTTNFASGAYNGTVVYRLTATGAADAGFGSGGKAFVSVFPGANTGDPNLNLTPGLAVEPNGDILLGGTDHAGQLNNTAGAIARLIGSNPPAGFVPAVRGTLTAGGPADGSAVTLTPTAGTYAAAGATAVYPGFPGEVRAATADVNGDGTPDYVYAAGPGGAPQVTIIDGATGRLVADFPAFEATFRGGVFVAAADLDGDGRAEVAVAPDQGGGGRVVVFSVAPGGGVTQRASFFGIDDPNFRGGARVALGDVDHDGKPDLVVAAGFGGGPRVAVFAGTTLLGTPARLVNDFFAFPGPDAVNLRNGAYVAAGDVDGDGHADLVFGGGPGGAPRVFVLSGTLVAGGAIDAAYAAPVANYFVAGNSSGRGGVRVAVTDADGDARADVAVGSGTGEPARVRVYRGKDFAGGGEPAAFQDLAPFGGVVLADGVYVG